MVKSLFDLCLAKICKYGIFADLEYMSCSCKQKLLEFFTSHDQINSKQCISLFSRPIFGCNLTKVCFYLSEQLTDNILKVLTSHGQQLEHIALIECPLITDQGVISLTINQKHLSKIELCGLQKLTSQCLKYVISPFLISVDLSGCVQIDSEGIFYLVFNNPSIKNLSLNSCCGLDDQALYDIGHCIGKNLRTLELDFLHNSKMIERAIAIENLSRCCPNIANLSLCRFFEDTIDLDNNDRISVENYRIEGVSLQDVDLYALGNYFSTLPFLPPTIRSIRLSVTGQEDVLNLVNRLLRQHKLINIYLQLICLEEDEYSIEKANQFLCQFISYIGSKITRLDITLFRLIDTAMSLIASSIPNLLELSLDVVHVSSCHLRQFFIGGVYSRGARLRSLKLSRSRLTYRALFAIGRGGISLTDLEASHMPCIDDRFLSLLADNCVALQNINFNGCKFVTDKGLTNIARKCLLKEVRIRGTSCTDKSIYLLAQFCPQLEWIAHSDFSGRPKFSDEALQCLRNSCIQRVIC